VLAAIGDASDYDTLLAALGKRSDENYLYYATWALGDWLRRSDVTVDKAAGAKVATQIANNDKLGSMPRNNALDAVKASGDASFKALAAKLSKDKDGSVASHAKQVLEAKN
jgi:hypothetical protein